MATSCPDWIFDASPWRVLIKEREKTSPLGGMVYNCIILLVILIPRTDNGIAQETPTKDNTWHTGNSSSGSGN